MTVEPPKGGCGLEGCRGVGLQGCNNADNYASEPIMIDPVVAM